MIRECPNLGILLRHLWDRHEEADRVAASCNPISGAVLEHLPCSPLRDGPYDWQHTRVGGGTSYHIGGRPDRLRVRRHRHPVLASDSLNRRADEPSLPTTRFQGCYTKERTAGKLDDMTIPAWDGHSVIPTIRMGIPETAVNERNNRSPYKSDVVEVVQRFGVTEHRIRLLNGFLDYRQALYRAGVQQGFQWIDGSFAEDVEHRRLDPHTPNDIDVVTFFYPPTPVTQELVDLFDIGLTKPNFHIDAYPVELGVELTQNVVETIAYWQSVWSHRRPDKMDKGFVQIDLDPGQDPAASAALNALEQRYR